MFMDNKLLVVKIYFMKNVCREDLYKINVI